MMESHYALYLDDPACPGFCSFAKLYVGTIADISKVMITLQEAGACKHTTDAFEAFMLGDAAATHFVAYQELRLLEPVTCVASSTMELRDKEWIHRNTWDWGHAMRLSEARVQELLVQHHGEYHRCLRAWIRNLQHKSLHGTWRLLGDMIWGHGAILDISDEGNGDRVMNNLLYVTEASYKTLTEAEASMNAPDKVSFESFCDEIFEDG